MLRGLLCSGLRCKRSFSSDRNATNESRLSSRSGFECEMFELCAKEVLLAVLRVRVWA